MKNILIINTGGTFNKVYDPLSGELIVDSTSEALEDIALKWLFEFTIINIIGKDSLDIDNHDRLELLATINQSSYQHILIIHGTDTMDITAQYLADAEIEKYIVFTGAMVPYSIDTIEATANLASAFGYLQALSEKSISIAMNGTIGCYRKVKKDRKAGKFIFL